MASQHYQSHSCVPVVCTGFAQGLYKAPKIKTAEPYLRACGLHRASRQIKTASKGIIRKECQSFTKYGHDKTPPTVFNPLSLWLTLPLNMGVSHTLWPPSITRATLACLWFIQGLYKAPKIKTADQFTLLPASFARPTCIWAEKVPFATFFPPRLSEKSRRELKRMYPTTGAATNSQSSLGVLLLLRQSPPYRSICVAHVFSKTTFSSGLMITKLKSNTKTTGWNKRPGASPTLTTRRNSPGTSRESIANLKDF